MARPVMSGWLVKPFDILVASRAELDAYQAGRVDGFLEGHTAGYADGWTACDVEIAALQRAAHRVVQAMAKLPTHADAVEAFHRHQVEAAEHVRQQLATLRDDRRPGAAA